MIRELLYVLKKGFLPCVGLMFIFLLCSILITFIVATTYVLKYVLLIAFILILMYITGKEKINKSK
jgi:hypothetical protein